MNSSQLTPGDKIRYFGIGRLAKRTAVATVESIAGRVITLRADSGNVLTVDITRIARKAS